MAVLPEFSPGWVEGDKRLAMLPESGRMEVKKITAVLFLIGLPAAACAALQPHQQAALEKILETVPVSMREAMRPQLEMSLGSLGPEQVRLLMEQYRPGVGDDAGPDEGESTDAVSASEDDAWNRRQIDTICQRTERTALSLRDKAAAKQQELIVRYERVAKGYGEYRLGTDAWGRPLSFDRSPAMLRAIIVDSNYDIIAGEGRRRFDFSGVRFPNEAGVLETMEKNLAEVEAVWERYEAEVRGLERLQFDDRVGGHSRKREEMWFAIREKALASLQKIPTPQVVVDEAVEEMYLSVRHAVLSSEPM